MNLVFFLCVGVFFIKNFDITRSEHQQNETILQLNLTNSDTNISEKLNNKSQKWIPELMDAAKMSFNMDSAISSKCKADFQLYKLHLQNQSIWAVRSMFIFFSFLFCFLFFFTTYRQNKEEQVKGMQTKMDPDHKL